MYLRSRTLKLPNSRDKATDTVSDGSIYLSMVQLSALWLLPHRVSELGPIVSLSSPVFN